VIGTLLSTLALVAVCFAPFYYMLAIFFTILCISVAISNPSFMALLSDVAYPDQIDKATSIATTLQEIGGIIGSVAGLVSVIINKHLIHSLLLTLA
jgi:MFS family permease